MKFLHELIYAKIAQSQAYRRAQQAAGLPDKDTDEVEVPQDENDGVENTHDSYHQEQEEEENISYIPLQDKSAADAYQLEMVRSSLLFGL